MSTRRVLQLGYLEPPPAAAREYGASAPWRSQTEEDALPPGATMSHGAYAPARLTYSPDGQNLKSSGYGPALDPISLEAEDWRSTRVEGAPRCLCKTSWSGKDTSGIVKRYPGGGCHNPDQDPTPWCFTEMGSNGQPCGNFFPNDPEQDPWTYCVDHCQAGRGVGEVHRIGCPVQVSQSPRHLLIARRSRCSTATQSVGRGGARADVRHTCLHACRRGGGTIAGFVPHCRYEADQSQGLVHRRRLRARELRGALRVAPVPPPRHQSITIRKNSGPTENHLHVAVPRLRLMARRMNLLIGTCTRGRSTCAAPTRSDSWW